MITADQLQEWAEEADLRIAELADRMVASGPKASHVSASELHEVADFVMDVGLVAIPALIAEVRRARAGQCVVGVSCAQHGGAVHGREAEELRAGIERIRKDHPPDHVGEHIVHAALRRLLDEVDARDSLAFLERGDAACDSQS